MLNPGTTTGPPPGVNTPSLYSPARISGVSGPKILRISAWIAEKTSCRRSFANMASTSPRLTSCRSRARCLMTSARTSLTCVPLTTSCCAAKATSSVEVTGYSSANSLARSSSKTPCASKFTNPSRIRTRTSLRRPWLSP